MLGSWGRWGPSVLQWYLWGHFMGSLLLRQQQPAWFCTAEPQERRPGDSHLCHLLALSFLSSCLLSCHWKAEKVGWGTSPPPVGAEFPGGHSDVPDARR